MATKRAMVTAMRVVGNKEGKGSKGARAKAMAMRVTGDKEGDSKGGKRNDDGNKVAGD